MDIISDTNSFKKFVTNLKYLSSVECDGALAGELEERHHDKDYKEGL